MHHGLWYTMAICGLVAVVLVQLVAHTGHGLLVGLCMAAAGILLVAQTIEYHRGR